MIKKIYKKVIPLGLRIFLINKTRQIYGWALRGKDYYCVCCNKHFKRFLNKGFGDDIRLNAQCPNCSSLERNRLLFYYLKNETTVFTDNPSILHVSPEECIKKHLIKNPNYYDIDIDNYKNSARYKVDITQKLPFPENKFDYIICSHVLGHIEQEENAANNLFRALNVDGRAIIITYIDQSSTTTMNFKLETDIEKLKKYGEFDLLRFHGLDFQERLSRENIEVEKLDYRMKFDEADRKKFSLGDGRREILFICRKIF